MNPFGEEPGPHTSGSLRVAAGALSARHTSAHATNVGRRGDVFASENTDYLRLARMPTVPGARTSLFVPQRDRLYLVARADRMSRGESGCFVHRHEDESSRRRAGHRRQRSGAGATARRRIAHLTEAMRRLPIPGRSKSNWGRSNISAKVPSARCWHPICGSITDLDLTGKHRSKAI